MLERKNCALSNLNVSMLSRSIAYGHKLFRKIAVYKLLTTSMVWHLPLLAKIVAMLIMPI